MRKIYYILTIITLLEGMTSCGTLPKGASARRTGNRPHAYTTSHQAANHVSGGEPTVTVPQPPPEILPHVEQFELDTGSVVTTEIRFTDKVIAGNPSVLGACYYYGKLIVINRHSFEGKSPELQEMLIYHELGHCLFRLEHDNRSTQDGYRASLMNRYLLTEEDYQAMGRDYYIQEFLSKINAGGK